MVSSSRVLWSACIHITICARWHLQCCLACEALTTARIALTCASHVQVNRLMQAQKEQLADERVVILGEHKKELQTLVSVMSASVNRDLPARIEGMVTREVRQAPLTFSLLAARTGHSAVPCLPEQCSQQS